MNCPNCAAPIAGPICEYCGTVHEHGITDDTLVHLKMDVAPIRFEALHQILTTNEIRKEFGLRGI